MAIYFNDKILAPNTGGNTLEKRYAKELPEVKEVFDLFRRKGQEKSTLIFRRDFEKVYNRKKTSWKPAPPVALPMVANVYLEDLGSVQVRYSKEPPTIQDGKKRYREADRMFDEITSISENEMDLAWFLLKATSYVDKGILKLENRKLEFDNKFDAIKRQAKPFALLFSDNRTREELIEVADIIFDEGGVNPDGNVSELAVSIWDKVKDGDARNKSYNYDSLYKALTRNNKGKTNQGQVVKIAKEDNADGDESGEGKGVTIEGGMLKAPAGVLKKDLVLKATAIGLDIDEEEMTRDFIYTMIKNKEDLVNS